MVLVIVLLQLLGRRAGEEAVLLGARDTAPLLPLLALAPTYAALLKLSTWARLDLT